MSYATTRTENCVLHSIFPDPAFNLTAAAAELGRSIRAPGKVAELSAGTRYADGLPVPDSPLECQRNVT